MTNPFAILVRRTLSNIVPRAATPSEPVAAPVAAQAAPVEPVGTPVRLGVVTGHSNYQLGKILSGVVGRLEGEGQDPTLTIDPRYQQVAYLFSLAAGGPMDQGTAYTEVVVPSERAADEFIANMISASRAKWASLYDSVGVGAAGGMMATMAANEKNLVDGNAQRVIASFGLQEYEIPVSYSAYVAEGSVQLEAASTQRDLLAAATVRAQSAITRQADADGVVAAARPAEPAPAGAPLSDEVRVYAGSFELEVNGVAKVLASSPESAAAVYDQLRAVSNSMQMGNVLTLEAREVKNVSLIPADLDDDDFVDSDFERDC